jgi:hypothetical protein
LKRPIQVRTIAIVFVMAMGAVTWITGTRHRFFDYDEIYHAHVSWLIAQGNRPFHDFLASHPPLLWYAVAPLWRILPNAPSTLLPLRLVGAMGTVLSIVAMTLAWSAVRRELPIGWLIVGIATIAFSRDVLDFGIEFRPDSWSTALLFFAFLLFLTRRPASAPLRCAVFGGLATLAVLTSPKFFLLPLLFGAIDVLRRVRDRDHAGTALIGYGAGLTAALLLVVGLLRVAHIDPTLAFQMGIAYQWIFLRDSGFHGALLDSVLSRPHLLVLIAAGVTGWCAHLFTARRWPQVYEMAVLLFLGLQLFIVDRPYKQYYGPWFLLAAGFVPFAGFYLERAFARARPWCFGLAIVLSGATALSAGLSFARHDGAQRMLAFYDAITEWSAQGDPIIAYPPLHPVVRRDVFYGWNRTTDPAGFGTETVMHILAVPGYSERFESPSYRRELDSGQPAVIVSPRNDDWGYEPGQWASVREFLAEHRASYVLVDRGLIQPVWVRRDRLARARVGELTTPAR